MRDKGRKKGKGLSYNGTSREGKGAVGVERQGEKEEGGFERQRREKKGGELTDKDSEGKRGELRDKDRKGGRGWGGGGE